MSNKSLGLRERKKLQTRKNILKYATRLFQKKGYENTAIGDICDKCEVSKATFFNYFDTKDQLLLEILSDDLEVMIEKVETARQNDKSINIKDILYIVCRQAIESITKYPYVSRLVYSKLLIDVESHSMHSKFKSLLITVIEESQEMGSIDKSLNSYEVYAWIEGLLLGMIVAPSNIDKEAKLDNSIKILLRGLEYKEI